MLVIVCLLSKPYAVSGDYFNYFFEKFLPEETRPKSMEFCAEHLVFNICYQTDVRRWHLTFFSRKHKVAEFAEFFINLRIHINFSVARAKMKMSLSLFIFTHIKYTCSLKRINFPSNQCNHKKNKRFRRKKLSNAFMAAEV